MEFLTMFGKDVAKNRSFGNNIIFLQQFFPFRGGGCFLCPSGNAYVITMRESAYFLHCTRISSIINAGVL